MIHGSASNGAEKGLSSGREESTSTHRTSNDPIAKIGPVRPGSPAADAVCLLILNLSLLSICLGTTKEYPKVAHRTVPRDLQRYFKFCVAVRSSPNRARLCTCNATDISLPQAPSPRLDHDHTLIDSFVSRLATFVRDYFCCRTIFVCLIYPGEK